MSKDKNCTLVGKFVNDGTNYFVSFCYEERVTNSTTKTIFDNGIFEMYDEIKSIDEINKLEEYIAEYLYKQTLERYKVKVLYFKKL